MNKKTTPVKRTHKTTKNSGKVFLKKAKKTQNFSNFIIKKVFLNPDLSPPYLPHINSQVPSSLKPQGA